MKTTDFLLCALGEYGEREISGELHNHRIVEYHRTTSLKATTDEVPWCSSFVNWVVQRCRTEGTNSAAAISWMEWGVELLKPCMGCIAVFRRKGGNHVGFFIRERNGQILIYGGNQGDETSFRWYSKADLLGYRLPK